MICGKIFKQH